MVIMNLQLCCLVDQYPSTFIHLMNKVFRTYLDIFVVVFIDDILIYSKVQAKHADHMRTMLQILSESKLYTKLSKYEFWLLELIF